MSNLKKDLKPIFFPVEKVDASTVMVSDLTFNPQLTHFIVTEQKGVRTVVNACSKNYHLISNEELMTPLVERLEKEYKVEARVTQTKNARFYVDFIIKDLALEVIKKDMIFPRIRMNNSYDGSVRYSFYFGFFRLVCLNGMTAPVKELSSGDFKLRHTPGTGGTALERTMESIEIFLDDAPKIIKGYQDLAKGKLTMDACMERIQEVIDNTKFPQKKMEKVLERLNIEKELGLPLNDFIVYNAFNHALYNDGSKAKMHKKDRLDQQILTYISNH